MTYHPKDHPLPSAQQSSELDAAEAKYCLTAFDLAAAPLGSRDWSLFWAGWHGRSKIPNEPSEAQKQQIISDFLTRTGQYVTNDASREAAIKSAVDAALRDSWLGAAQVLAGWKLVPVEPTDAMLDAAARASMQHLLDCINDPSRANEVGSEKNVRITHGSRYRSMLAAAPKSDATRIVQTFFDVGGLDALVAPTKSKDAAS